MLGTLGRGGMGTVLEAFDRTLDRRVALKVLHRDLGTEHTQRLVREAQAMAKLSHPHVVQVFEVGVADGRAFIAMELCRGRSLRDWMEQRPRPGWRECIEVMLQAGEGLAAAHAVGLVHRDFKPTNAIIDERGRVRVLDFGLARRAEEPTCEDVGAALAELEVSDSSLGRTLTQTGAILGTPAYMPMEQLKGRDADARSDQFAFCVALYEALYGERPYEGASMAARMMSLKHERLRPPPRGTTVPAAVRKVVVRGLAYRPEHRHPSMVALLAELRRLVAPRTRRWLALGVAAGLAAMGVGIGQYAEVGFRCDGARAQLSGVWDDDARQQLRHALTSEAGPHAKETWDRVEARLDDYADAWVERHTEACEATSVRQEQSAEVMDRRMECLGRGRVALREAVAVLGQADDVGRTRAVDLVAGLPDLARCDDVGVLLAALPPPEDPWTAQWVDTLREHLDRARSLAATGEFDRALAVAEPVVEQAPTLDYPPIEAEARLARGIALQAAGRYAEAQADLEQAYLLAAEHGHEAVEAEASATLAFVVGVALARRESGLQWGRIALALARRRGPRAEAQALSNLGAVLSNHHDRSQALRHHRRALALRQQALDPDHPAIASSLNNIGLVLHDQGQLDEALDHHRRALEIWERALGPHHPTVAISLSNIGHVLLKEGKHAEALAYYRRALIVAREALGPEHPEVSGPLQYIGVTLTQMGDAAGGLAHHRQALVLREQTLGPEHPSTILSQIQMGDALRQLERWAPARTHYRRALQLADRALEPDHPYRAFAVDGLVEAELALEDFGSARDHAEQALARRQAQGDSAEQLAGLRFGLARALWGTGRSRAQARALARSARDAQRPRGAQHQARLAQIEAWMDERGVR